MAMRAQCTSSSGRNIIKHKYWRGEGRTYGHRPCARNHNVDMSGTRFKISPISLNTRLIHACVTVHAPREALWCILTDYHNLAAYIPGLQENVVTKVLPNGCMLKQVARQSVGFVWIYVLAHLIVTEHRQGFQCLDVQQQSFPKPYNWGLTSKPWDITFELLDGDLEVYNGIWRMQDVDVDTSLLSYVLVTPSKLLPVALIQQFIEKEVRTNLAAIKAHAERSKSSWSSSSSG